MTRTAGTPDAIVFALKTPGRFAMALTLLLSLAGCASGPSSPSAQIETRQVTQLDGKPVLYKTVPRATYFVGNYDLPPEQIRSQTKPLAEKVGIAAVKKAKLDIVGPLTLFLPDWREQTGDQVTIGVGFPVSGSGQLVPQFEQSRKDALACLSVTLEAGADSNRAWQQLHVIADQQGMQASGDNRAVITRTEDSYQTELQLGLQ
ncbi:hypothetical protein [Marinobacter sp. CHS3-4]|uniref:hypothetical protein n=1 Tax=Marinobacter sp. CHS3-4 TaxID=3045174 RepID=UPI0024B53F84|nr:hypothetical protein [Marinobacter sp. CHS3-4]MDI9244209.1 hypothetical protein [Marinobacter sp. CHS3-4]